MLTGTSVWNKEYALRAACALIENTGTNKRGSGYLVTRSVVATAWHVVDGLLDDEKINLRFNGHPELETETRTGTIIKYDEDLDVALVELDRPVEHHEPVVLAIACESDLPWLGVGYPIAVKTAPKKDKEAVLIGGVVRGALGKELQLHSAEAASGRGGDLHGWSGGPVAINGGVVGHLRQVVPDKDDDMRAALGIVYACKAEHIKALLDTCNVRDQLTTVVKVSPPLLIRFRDLVPNLGLGEFHAWIRESNSPLVKLLGNRLEAYGLRIVVDTRSFPSNAESVAARDSLVAKCGVALLVGDSELSRDNRWKAERDALVQSSRVVGIWFGKGKPPATPFEWIEFGMDASGPGIEALCWATIDKTPPPTDSASSQVDASQRTVDDAALRELRRAARRGPIALRQAYGKIKALGVEPTLYTAEQLLGMAEPHQALELLADAAEGPRALQLKALALARLKRRDEAIDILEDLYEEQGGAMDPETIGILAGRYKDKWLDTGEKKWAYRAYELYRRGLEELNSPYNGINAASLALQPLGQRDRAKELAQKTLDVLREKARGDWDYWAYATEGEALSLLGDMQSARTSYGTAAALAEARKEDITVMLKQARRNLEALGGDATAFDDVLS